MPLCSLEGAQPADVLATADAAELPIEKPAAAPQNPEAEHQLAVACDHDPRLVARVLPFAGLMRRDSFDQLLLIQEDSLHVAPGSERRSTGTHYTPRTLTEPIVLHTLEPLVYVGPAEGLPQSEWKLKSPKEILALKVCDMAMGSGAFLVQVCRYLAERLVEAWELQERELPKPDPSASSLLVVLPDGSLSNGSSAERLMPADAAERIALARRYVADRCLYGVDINPMAVEMAKLSLWLITLQRDRPFTFLDHALKCGDSLLGISSFEQLSKFSFTPTKEHQVMILQGYEHHIKAAIQLRQTIESLPSETNAQIERKNVLNYEANAHLVRLKLSASVLLSVEMQNLKGDAAEMARVAAHLAAHRAVETGEATDAMAIAEKSLSNRRPFHWPLEFPEVFDAGERSGVTAGFDAFVGNPPFMGGQKITGELGIDYRDYLVEKIASGQRGSADFCAYFFLRAYSLLSPAHGMAGLIATNTLAQGDTREVGLDQIVNNLSGVVIRAVPSVPWPGNAALEVSHVWIRRGKWTGAFFINDILVAGVTAYLTQPTNVAGKPKRLAVNSNRSFIGSYVLGMGFVLNIDEAQTLLKQNPRNKEVVQPYINGEELNTRPDQSPMRWIINFFDSPLDRTCDGCWAQATKDVQDVWLRNGRVPPDYPGKVAADFPECLAVVERLVKPERIRKKDNGEFVLRAPMPQKWWIYAEKRPALYRAIKGLKRVLAKALTSKHHAVSFLPNGLVYDQTIPIFALESSDWFAVLQSDIHALWALDFGASLETRPRYTPSDCFETFPFPVMTEELLSLGAEYHQLRQEVMTTRQEGLTKIYNRFNNPNEHADDIKQLRQLHSQMNQSVCRAYEWDNIHLGQGFRETKAGLRYTISGPAWQNIRDRLLELNHRLHAVENPAETSPSPVKRKRSAGLEKSEVGELRLFD